MKREKGQKNDEDGEPQNHDPGRKELNVLVVASFHVHGQILPMAEDRAPNNGEVSRSHKLSLRPALGVSSQGLHE